MKASDFSDSHHCVSASCYAELLNTSSRNTVFIETHPINVFPFCSHNIQLHNEELHDFYLSPNKRDQIKEDELNGAFSTNGRDEKTVQNSGREIWREYERDLGVNVNVFKWI
jgi:hypothetical protein